MRVDLSQVTFIDSSGIGSLIAIRNAADSAAVPDAYVRAWGAAFVLMAFILVANIGARVLLARSRKRTQG